MLPSLTNTKAFSLIEILASIVLLSLLLAAAVPYVAWVNQKADNDNAIHRALLLNSAKSQYLLENGYIAHTAFNAKTDSAKYLALRTYLGYSDNTLADYVPTGYTYSLEDLGAKTAITDIGSSALLEY